MKRLLFLLLALGSVVSEPVFADEVCGSTASASYAPVCACTHHTSYCDLKYDDWSAESACTAYCKATYGEYYISAQYDDKKDSCEGKAVINACNAINSTREYAERHNDAALQAYLASGANIPSYPTPTLQVNIPDVSFAKPLLVNGVLSSNFIGQYISGVYKFLIGFAMTVAIVMMMIGGLQYVIGASSGDIKSAQNRIKNAVAGFVLLLFVYVILFTVNPELTIFKNLEIQVIPPEPQEFEDDFITGATVATGFGTPTGTNITGKDAGKIPTELVSDITNVASAMAKYGYGIVITSTLRSLDKQIALISKNCQNPPGSATCDPKPDHPNTCILRNKNAADCPHTTGRALDIWGTSKGIQCISQDACMANLNACRANSCQAALISTMKTAGFCNLQSEPWHFEKPKMSSNCN